jgi:hypothetical protein
MVEGADAHYTTLLQNLERHLGADREAARGA